MAYREYRKKLYETYFSSSGYEQRNPSDTAAYQANARILRQILLPHLPTRRDAAIVDVACGTGYAVYMLQQAGYSCVRGFDLSQEQVAQASARGLPVRQADALEFLSGVQDQYDAIVAFDFIEHLDRDELLAFLETVAKALRPGGRLIVKTPNASCLFGSRSRYLDLTHEIAFTEKSLRAAFVVSGLDPLVITGERIRPVTLKGWVRWVPARLVRLLWKAYLIAELAEEGFSIPTQFNLIGVASKSGLQ